MRYVEAIAPLKIPKVYFRCLETDGLVLGLGARLAPGLGSTPGVAPRLRITIAS